jgi:hypothetical protein
MMMRMELKTIFLGGNIALHILPTSHKVARMENQAMLRAPGILLI